MWQLASDTISHADMDALADWLRTYPRLTQGEHVRAFEAAWAKWLGSAHAVFVSSGTTANFALVAVVAQRLKRRPLRVGVSAVTWSTNVTPSQLLGHELVVFDVNPTTLGVDRAQACAAMRAGAIDVLFVTHLLGFNAIDDALLRTARETGVVLLEDCCEAHGARHGERRVGTLGLGSTFSFYYGHHMSTIEGGVVCTDDAELADALRMMRAHGLARESHRFDALAAQYPDVDRRFLFVTPGLNFRSTELNAFLGLRQLATLDARIAHRNAVFARFHQQLAGTGLAADYATEGISSYALPLVADTPARAQQVRAVVDALGIESRPVVAGNLLRQPFLREAAAHGVNVTVWGGAVPHAEHLHTCGLYVGNGHHVATSAVDTLMQQLGSRGAAVPT